MLVTFLNTNEPMTIASFDTSKRESLVSSSFRYITELFSNPFLEKNRSSDVIDPLAMETRENYTKKILSEGEDEEGMDSSLSRFLAIRTQNDLDDFNRQDEICIDYIKQFISGATDIKDECEVRSDKRDAPETRTFIVPNPILFMCILKHIIYGFNTARYTGSSQWI